LHESRLTDCAVQHQVFSSQLRRCPMPALARKIDFGHGNQRAELPLLEPTLGPPMIDTRRLREETGCWAYDPSFGATGACRSAITYVDGDDGILLYRGYPIDQLVERCDYL